MHWNTTFDDELDDDERDFYFLEDFAKLHAVERCAYNDDRPSRFQRTILLFGELCLAMLIGRIESMLIPANEISFSLETSIEQNDDRPPRFQRTIQLSGEPIRRAVHVLWNLRGAIGQQSSKRIIPAHQKVVAGMEKTKRVGGTDGQRRSLSLARI